MYGKFKNRFIIMLTLMLTFITASCFAEAIQFSGWTTLVIPGEVQFQIPPTMKAQEESLNALTQTPSPDSNQKTSIVKLTAQQKELNSEADKDHFALVTVQVSTNNAVSPMPGFGEPLGFTSDDLEVWEEAMVDNLKSALNSPEMKDKVYFLGITQYAEIMYLDKKEVVHFAYTTQKEGYPPDYNDEYVLYNRNKSYRVSTKIRSTEYDYWTQDDADVRDIVRTLQPLQ